MYNKFGEFDSYQEINEAAEGQKQEGDKDALIELAKENGIDEEDALDYLEGVTDMLCDPMMAAHGKIRIESADLNPRDIMEDWRDYIISLCDYSDPDMSDKAKEAARQMCIAVRRKDRSLQGCLAALLKWSFSHQQKIDQDILKEANVKAGKVTLGIPGMATAHKIIRDYYMKGGDKA